MKRVMLLALLALALPTAALATSINFNSGTFMSGTVTGSIAQGQMLNVSVTGSLNTISIDTGNLTKSSSCIVPGAQCFTFSTGTVTVSSGGSTVFTDSLLGGAIIDNRGSISVVGTLAPNTMIASGSTNFDYAASAGVLSRGTAGINAVATPEPGTLGLLGTGLIGLGVVVRRRLKLPT